MMSENEETTLSLAVVLREKGMSGGCESRTLGGREVGREGEREGGREGGRERERQCRYERRGGRGSCN